MKCLECRIKIPELPEDATYDEMLCNRCYEKYENKEINIRKLSEEGENE